MLFDVDLAWPPLWGNTFQSQPYSFMHYSKLTARGWGWNIDRRLYRELCLQVQVLLGSASGSKARTSTRSCLYAWKRSSCCGFNAYWMPACGCLLGMPNWEETSRQTQNSMEGLHSISHLAWEHLVMPQGELLGIRTSGIPCLDRCH